MTRATRVVQSACQSQLGQNILTNYLAVIWMGGLSIALIPLYLKRLGPEQWGVVAICMAIQGFLGLLDAGLGQIMPRDIARVAGDRIAEARIFRVFSRSYLALGILGLLVGQASVPWLIEHWFNQGQGLGDGADLALRLVLVQFMFQFANNAHAGYWNGLQAQKLANFRQCAFGTAKHAGALALVYIWSADALAYLLPFALVSAIEWLANRHTVQRVVGEFRDDKICFADFRLLAREAGVLVIGVLIGMIVVQIDRIVLSRAVDAESFGRYVIVANLGLAFMQLQYPLMRALLPRIVQVDRKHSKTKNLWVGVMVLCVLPCSSTAFFAPWLLNAWIGDPKIVNEGVAPLRLILIAVAINSMYQLVYQKIIVFGDFRILILINLATLFVVSVQLFLTTPAMGIVAGGFSWITITLMQLGLGCFWLFSNRNKNII